MKRNLVIFVTARLVNPGGQLVNPNEEVEEIRRRNRTSHFAGGSILQKVSSEEASFPLLAMRQFDTTVDMRGIGFPTSQLTVKPSSDDKILPRGGRPPLYD